MSTAIYAMDDAGRQVEVRGKTSADSRRPPHVGHIAITPLQAWYPAQWVMTLNGWMDAAFLLVMLAFLFRAAIRQSAGQLLSIAAAVMLLFGLMHRTLGRWASQRRIGSALGRRLVVGRCGACEYDLSRTPAADTGLRTCPECSAAWNVDQWQREFPALADEPDTQTWVWPGLRVRDARGRQMRFMQWLDADEAAGLRRKLRAQDARGILMPSGREMIAPALIVLLVGGFIAYMLWFSLLGPDVWQVIGLIVTASMVGLFPFALVRWSIVQHANREKIAAECTSRGSCAHCAGPLSTWTARDGARVCQACGAAWKDPATSG